MPSSSKAGKNSIIHSWFRVDLLCKPMGRHEA